ncbi:MAG: hypothetical protein ACLFQZ_04315 [Spirochaetaceae bacterium]
MKRSSFVAALCTSFVILLLSCAQDPPFDVVSGEEAIAGAEPGFGHYVYRPKGMNEVSVHRRSYALELMDRVLAEGVEVVKKEIGLLRRHL